MGRRRATLGQSRPTLLVSRGVVLRPWSRGDLVQLTSAYADDDVRRWTPIGRSLDDRTTAAIFLSNAERYWRMDLPNFAIARERDLLGAIGCVAKPAPGELEIAYWLTKEARGSGIATEALTVMSRWALGLTGVHTLRAEIVKGNLASLNCARRAGFVVRGEIQRKYADSDVTAVVWDTVLSGQPTESCTTGEPELAKPSCPGYSLEIG